MGIIGLFLPDKCLFQGFSVFFQVFLPKRSTHFDEKQKKHTFEKTDLVEFWIVLILNKFTQGETEKAFNIQGRVRESWEQVQSRRCKKLVWKKLENDSENKENGRHFLLHVELVY